MSLWGKTDNAAGSPKNLSSAEEDKTYFVDTTEVEVASNRAKGIKTPGWAFYTEYTDANGNTRKKFESLVPMKVSAADAGDEGLAANTDIEDATVADS